MKKRPIQQRAKVDLRYTEDELKQFEDMWPAFAQQADWQRRSAEAIAYRIDDRMAMLIDEDNQNIGYTSIADALLRGCAYAVRVDLNVLAVESDDPARQAVVHNFVGEMRAKSYSPVVSRSGRAGHLHVFCRIPNGKDYAWARKRAQDLGLQLRDWIRPPFSPHRYLPSVSSIVDPPDRRKALESLRSSTERRKRLLSQAMLELLRSGDLTREYNGKLYDSRSNAIQAMATAAVNCRWTFSEYYRVMITSPLFAKLATRSDDKIYLKRCWKKALEFVRMNPRRSWDTIVSRSSRYG
jgi:hypothetical protein